MNYIPPQIRITAYAGMDDESMGYKKTRSIGGGLPSRIRKEYREKLPPEPKKTKKEKVVLPPISLVNFITWEVKEFRTGRDAACFLGVESFTNARMFAKNKKKYRDYYFLEGEVTEEKIHELKTLEKPMTMKYYTINLETFEECFYQSLKLLGAGVGRSEATMKRLFNMGRTCTNGFEFGKIKEVVGV